MFASSASVVAAAFLLLAALAVQDAHAIGCTDAQRTSMLNSITQDPAFATCQRDTAPFDFYTALTQTGPAPTAADAAKFTASAACGKVYDHFQAAIKAANCDEVSTLVGLPFDQLLPVATPTTTLAATMPMAAPSAATTLAPTAKPATTPASTGKPTPSLAAASASVAFAALMATLGAML
ncbi:Aste57867_15382 [Aphanomyces stellatus]|uniref:Aste57867_15382 protein n=1 Tax=Aphanomyces stellatus TaxID=120398 RepID=A0A485L4D1_9STRA|nr:hypothetical protein As57867_015326 [Aphanomyces stellatus]VFT92188.1 Aste57867_15382 [Aphanomyces stellatus]